VLELDRRLKPADDEAAALLEMLKRPRPPSDPRYPMLDLFMAGFWFGTAIALLGCTVKRFPIVTRTGIKIMERSAAISVRYVKARMETQA
jgi:hypothetical protein